MLRLKLPLPVPEAPDVTLTQVTGTANAHLQVGAAVMVPVVLPPAAVNDALLKLMTGAVGHSLRASWVKVNVVAYPIEVTWPEPLREAVVSGLAATE